MKPRQLSFIEKVILQLKDSEPSARAEAAIALGMYKQFLDGPAEKAFVELLLPYLSDENHRVRRYTAQSLGFLGQPEAIEPLKEAMEKEENGVAKNMMKEAINKLSS